MTKKVAYRHLFEFIEQPRFRLLLIWFGVNWSWIELTDGVTLAGSALAGRLLATICLATIVLVSTGVILQAFNLTSRLIQRLSPAKILFITLPLFAFADWLVSWLSVALWYGPQGRIDSVGPIASPGLLLLHTPLGYASRFIGFYGLSSIIWTLAYLFSQKKYYKLIPILMSVCAMLSLAGWAAYRSTSGEALRVKIVNETLEKRVPSINASDTKLVVFPEYGFDRLPPNDISSRLTSESKEPTYFISSRQLNRFGLDGHYNQRLFGNTKEGITDIQDKYRLIPGGEDLSYAMRIILLLTQQNAVLDYFASTRGVVTGDHQLRPLKIDNHIIIGSAICSSIISPEDYRSLTRQGSTVLTNSASLEIFEGSSVFTWQQKSLAQFMAIANARPFIQSVNSAHAFVLDANGHTITSLNNPGTADTIVQTNDRVTFYTYSGEWLAILGGIITVCYYLQKFLQPRRRGGIRTPGKKHQ